MPLTSKGNSIMSSMEKQYGPEKGKSVFYASKNKGTISGVDADTPAMLEYKLGEARKRLKQARGPQEAQAARATIERITKELSELKGGKDAELEYLGQSTEMLEKLWETAKRTSGPSSPEAVKIMHELAKRMRSGTKGAHDAMPMRFACDGVPACQGQIVAHIGNCVLLQGMALDSGAWFVRGPDGPRRFTVKQDALDYIEYAQDAVVGSYKGWRIFSQIGGSGMNSTGYWAETGRAPHFKKTKFYKTGAEVRQEIDQQEQDSQGTRDAEPQLGSHAPNKEGQELYKRMSGHAQSKERQNPQPYRSGMSRQDLEGMDIEKATVSYAKPKEAEPPTAAEMATAGRRV